MQPHEARSTVPYHSHSSSGYSGCEGTAVLWRLTSRCACGGIQRARRELSAAGLEGVQLGGNYVAGVALGKCVEYGYDLAADIARQLNSQPV